MSDIVTAQVFSDGETGITAAKMNGIVGRSVIQPDFYQNKPVSSSMDPADIFLLLKGNGSFAQVLASNVSASVSGTLILANSSQSGMLHQTTGNASDYCGGDNQFHPLVNAIPTGVSLDFRGNAAPTGFLLENGAAVSRTVYAALFAVIGTTYGAGDGSTTFNVPDSRGRASIGAGQGSGLTNRVLGATGGEELHSLASGELASHTHPIAAGQFSHTHTDAGHPHFYDYIPNVAAAGSGVAFNGITGAGSASAIATRNGTASIQANTLPSGVTASTGSGTGHNTMMPFLVATKIIKT